jgi:hypothetical protein
MKSLLVALLLAAAAAPAFAQAPADSLDSFLKGLADSTDVSYGTQSVTFDTTGLDTLALNALSRPPALPRRSPGAAFFPLLGFHRAEGWIVGAGARVGSRAAGWLEPSGTYSFSNEQARYAFGWRRTLLYDGPRLRRTLVERGRINPGTTRLDVELRYARESLPFAPEHATPRIGNPDAFLTGNTSSSLYYRRGFEGSLTLWKGDWRFEGGVRDAKEDRMPLVNDFALFTHSENIPANVQAGTDDYTEPFGSIGWVRTDLEAGALAEFRGGGGDRWRARGVLAKALRFGAPLKAYAQVEYGAAAANAPIQRTFWIGGPRAVPTLVMDSGGGDHMLLGKLEFIEAHDVLKATGLPHPDWLVLQPLFGVRGGAAWDRGENALFATPPSEAWAGSAYGGLAFRLGIPEPDVFLRMFVAFPIGPNAGQTTFRVMLRAPFDLLGPL